MFALFQIIDGLFIYQYTKSKQTTRHLADGYVKCCMCALKDNITATFNVIWIKLSRLCILYIFEVDINETIGYNIHINKCFVQEIFLRGKSNFFVVLIILN